ncbi:hypothetical protein ACSNOI_43200, partial [Actinomadura kijaniata]
MSEQRPTVPGDPADKGGEEPTLEWFADLKDDADDPELHAVNPAVAQAYEAILEEGEEARPERAEQAPPAPQAPEIPEAPAPQAPAFEQPAFEQPRFEQPPAARAPEMFPDPAASPAPVPGAAWTARPPSDPPAEPAPAPGESAGHPEGAVRDFVQALAAEGTSVPAGTDASGPQVALPA